jgi:hypothetical protein
MVALQDLSVGPVHFYLHFLNSGTASADGYRAVPFCEGTLGSGWETWVRRTCFAFFFSMCGLSAPTSHLFVGI